MCTRISLSENKTVCDNLPNMCLDTEPYEPELRVYSYRCAMLKRQQSKIEISAHPIPITYSPCTTSTVASSPPTSR